MALLGTDQITIVDLTDGYTVSMSPEAYAWPATATAAIAGSLPILISAMVGNEAIPASVNTANIKGPGGGALPTGVSVTKDANPDTPTLTVSVTTAVTTASYIDIPVVVGGVTIVKRFAYSLAKTGAGGSAGVHATNVVVGNDAVVIPTTTGGTTLSSSSVSIPFAGWLGASRVAATVAVTNLPAGITVGTNTAATTSADGTLVLNIANGSTLGGGTSGTITLTFSANGQTQVKLFTWAKSMKGGDGQDGADALLLAVTSSQGEYFKNSAIATTLTARVFKGGVEVTGGALTALGTISWYKDNNFTTAVGTGATLTISAGQVTNKAIYEARLED